MRGLFRSLGSLLVLAGFLAGASSSLRTGGPSIPESQPVEQSASVELPATATVAPPPAPVPGPALTTRTPEPRLPVTRVVIPSIGLDTEVVAAPLVDGDGGRTWRVPAFKAGHAEATAGAGQPGNAVLMGHVSSLHSGNVFKNLDRVQVGDQVAVFSGERRFTYRVYETHSVPRTDLAMLNPTSEPVISVFTCTGAWDPVIWDFTERLFVHARLVNNS